MVARRVGTAEPASCVKPTSGPPLPHLQATLPFEPRNEDVHRERRHMAKFGIGQAVRRVEDQRFLTGQGRYVDDISLPGQAYGVTVLSPHAPTPVSGGSTWRARRPRPACCACSPAPM